jgi:hypothetical protein
VRILIGTRIARRAAAASRIFLGRWLDNRPDHLATVRAHAEAFGLGSSPGTIPIAGYSQRTVVDPPDVFLSAHFESPRPDGPTPRRNVTLGVRPDIITTLLAFFLAVRFHFFKPGLECGRIPRFEICRRELRIAATTVVVGRLRQATHRTFGVGKPFRSSSGSQRAGTVESQAANRPPVTSGINCLPWTELTLCLEAPCKHHIHVEA